MRAVADEGTRTMTVVVVVVVVVGRGVEASTMPSPGESRCGGTRRSRGLWGVAKPLNHNRALPRPPGVRSGGRQAPA